MQRNESATRWLARLVARSVPGMASMLLVVFGITSPGSAREAIRLANRPALSPDGKTLAFEWAGDIWTAPSTGGRAARLTVRPARDTQPCYSPDGGRIAFVSDRDVGRQVFVMAASGGPATQVTFHTEGFALNDWYPDGESLLVSQTRDHFWRDAERFFRVKIEGGAAPVLLFDAAGEEGSLSANGKQLLFTREGVEWSRQGYRGSRASQVWLGQLEEKAYSKLLDHQGGCRWPLFRPDAKAVYYVAQRDGVFNLWERDIDSDADRQLTDFSEEAVVFPCISRDGSTIVFRRLFDLYRLEPGKDAAPIKIELYHEGEQLRPDIDRRVLERASEASFSADGLEVALIAGADLWVMDTELREPIQITDTPEEESNPAFSPAGDSILFVSDKNGQSDVWSARRGDAEKHWWRNTSFDLKPITQDAEVDSSVSFSPDGSQVAFVKGRGDLWLMKPDGKEPRRLLSSWSPPDYEWSPDGKWLVYAQSDNDFNRDIWIAAVDGSRPPFNLSRHPDNDGDPVWSPDSKMIAFSGRRIDREVDLYYVWLQKQLDDTTSRQRKLEKALEKIKKARKKPASKNKKDNGAPKKKDEKADEQDAEDGEKDGEPQEESENDNTTPDVNIDFDDIHERIHRIAIPQTAVGNLFWSYDSKKLAFTATIDGKRGTYTLEFPDPGRPKLLTTQTGSQPKWIKQGNQIVWLSSGTPASMTDKGKGTSYSFLARQSVNLQAKRKAAFDLCWRTMRDRYYDEKLGNHNWDAVRRKYIDMAARAPDDSAFGTVVNLMLGELNGSHLGFYVTRATATTASGSSAPRQWRPVTAHLGVRFESEYQGPGLKIRDVLPGGPAEREQSRLHAGEVILSIDGQSVDPQVNLAKVLTGSPNRDIVLMVRGKKSKDGARDSDEKDEKDKETKKEEKDRKEARDEDQVVRTVILRPTSYGAARSMLYEKWIEENRQSVDQSSMERLGYLHIRGMNMTSFYRFERELYSAGVGKDGLIIDVRNNGGGSTTDLLLTALTQPRHAITVPRGGGQGYPHDRKVFASWNKPIAVLCNQNSFSNAEIFSHAIKTLGRGQLIGAPTAGGVISTGGTRIMDVGFLRIPFRGWFLLNDGEDMELNGAVPHHILWPAPGDLPAGKDVQLAKAVEVLLADVKKWKARPQPELRKASQR